jgi:hypothetical protein
MDMQLDYEFHAARMDVEQKKMSPFYLLRPRMFPDGNLWCVLYGEDVQSGVVGFGDTPEHAAEQFDWAWRNQKASNP